jgi:hypothetical protein
MQFGQQTHRLAAGQIRQYVGKRQHRDTQTEYGGIWRRDRSSRVDGHHNCHSYDFELEPLLEAEHGAELVGSCPNSP